MGLAVALAYQAVGAARQHRQQISPHRRPDLRHNPGMVPGPAPGATGADLRKGEGISASPDGDNQKGM